MSLWFLFFFILPLVIVYINHLMHSNNVVFSFDKMKRQFHYRKNGKLISFNQSEIKDISLFLAPPAYDNRFDILFIGSYHYAEITLHNDNTIIISCLICKNIPTLFPSSLVQKKKKFIPIIN